MKKIITWLSLAALSLSLCACGQDEQSDNPVIPESLASISSMPSDNSISYTDDSSTEDDADSSAANMVRSRLTNEWVTEEIANTRPIAVMTPNEIGSIPHYNLGEASIIYEANVEGRMTRMMAIYENWQELDKIGNVRSLRNYYAYWAFEWDALLVHVGGPFFINDILENPNTQTIDEGVAIDSAAFFRSSDRSAPHNTYVSGEKLPEVIEKNGYPLNDRGLTDEYHYQFAGEENPNTLTQYGEDAKDAVYIDMSGCYPLTRCYFEYNEGDGLYYRSQHLSSGTDGSHEDALTGKQLCFKNILVQNTVQEDIGEGYLAFQVHDTEKDGWFFTNGKGIHVTWEKTSDYGATRYYDDFGNEITLNTGKTMVCIVADGDNFTFR